MMAQVWISKNGQSHPVSKATDAPAACELVDPKLEKLVNELIGAVADKWTMLILEALLERPASRFTQLSRAVEGISQKMLTQTLRQMERNGLVSRHVYPVVPPRVEYTLTELGSTLSEAFCGVWKWAEANLDHIEAARDAFDRRDRPGG